MLKSYFMIISMITFLMVLSGCSSKNQSTPTKQETVAPDLAEESFEDEMLDEFEEEMKTKEETSDPLEGYNRVMTTVNDHLYEYLLSPVANGYKKVTHKEVRSSVANFFHNLLYPIRLINNVLQGKFHNSGEETGRFLINSTVGVLGLFDVAKSHFNLQAHNEDFGQTLGYWGVEGGPHIVLPILGPSNLRDTISLYPDSLINPIDYHENRSYNVAKNWETSLALKSLDKVNMVANSNGAYELMKKDAIDLYPYLKNSYEQYRQKQIEE
jgi:phospholipid-binding lipoprotein MlaA